MAKSRENKRGVQTAYVSTIVGIVLVLFFMGIAAWLALGFNHLKNSKIESYEVSLYFNETVNDLELKMIETEIAAKDYTSKAFYRSADDALAIYREEVDEDIDLSIIDGENPLDQHIVMSLKKDFFSIEQMQQIEKELMTEYNGRIKEVIYQEEIFENYGKNLQKPIYFISVIGILLLIISIGLINNTIRLALFSKRFLIKTMQLVGATPRFIQRPFFMAAIGQGLLSGLIAGCLLLGLIYVIEKNYPIILEMTNVGHFYIVFAILILFGVLITVVSTQLALRKYLRLDLDNLY
ncbi:permease-like cell division protein FtsX [Paracrocinitomix mangrovi]|uniref:cell division protein FtsX n=1 Tax=Paracrocinitomix mangrovi TaxID=2862509 RepID=UPI001C8EE3B5|nr:permease-like cell division protein FtsX [Paracrocinitomix mangrovi]UKN00906.1 permease-like cell division protein FtsX [Paracrocinitomix mangrovi]